jgi:hypothetical protein
MARAVPFLYPAGLLIRQVHPGAAGQTKGFVRGLPKAHPTCSTGRKAYNSGQ